MTTFTIDTDNNIAALGQEVDAGTDAEVGFDTEKAFAAVSGHWPTDRYVAIWNSFAGVPPFGTLKPVKKFKDRASAVSQIWSAIQALVVGDQASQDAPPAKPPRKKASKPKKVAKARPVAKPPKASGEPGGKAGEVVAMMRRKGGATIADIMSATGWQKHTVRGFVAGSLKKKFGLAVESFRSEEKKERTYRLR